LNLANENQVETARWLGFDTSSLRPNWCSASDNCKNSKLGIDLDLPHDLQTEAENKIFIKVWWDIHSVRKLAFVSMIPNLLKGFGFTCIGQVH